MHDGNDGIQYLDHALPTSTNFPGPSNTMDLSKANSQSSLTSLDSSSTMGVESQVVDVSKLSEVFPKLSQEQLKFVYAQSGNDFMMSMNCLLEGPCVDSIRTLLRSSRIKGPIADSPRIRLEDDDDDDDWVSAAITFYKSPRFDANAEVRISIRGQPGVDTGGVRRQFFTVVLEKLAASKMYSLFEGPADSLRPSFRMSNLSSGLLKIVGQMVAHSFVLDGQGFPFLSECIYYYLAGLVDKAITLVTDDDLSAQVKTLVEEV